MLTEYEVGFPSARCRNPVKHYTMNKPCIVTFETGYKNLKQIYMLSLKATKYISYLTLHSSKQT